MSSLVPSLVNLFFFKRCLRVEEQEFKVSRLDLMCCFQVCILLKVKPRHLTVSNDGIGMLSTDRAEKIHVLVIYHLRSEYNINKLKNSVHL